MLINQGAATVEDQNQLKNASRNRERIRSIINHPSINATLIIIVLNVTVGNQICASDVDRRITSSQFSETGKSGKESPLEHGES